LPTGCEELIVPIEQGSVGMALKARREIRFSTSISARFTNGDGMIDAAGFYDEGIYRSGFSTGSEPEH
jgi:hypothetical protein